MKLFSGFNSVAFALWRNKAEPFKVMFDPALSFKEKILRLCGLFNRLNQLMRQRAGVYLPFSVGVPADELFDPVGIEHAQMLKKAITPFRFVSIENRPAVNFFLPSIEPQIIFGGYIAAFNFIKGLVECDVPVRIVVCDSLGKDIKQIKNELKDGDVAKYCIERCEIIDPKLYDNNVTLGSKDLFVGYSWVTMRQAAAAAEQVNGSKPVFFIQEYESIFYSCDSFRFFCDATYKIDHYALFNSPQLADYFKLNRLGVFSQSSESDQWMCFRQSIADVQKPNVEELKNREKKKLLFYARPEGHASRNLFEAGFLALAKACEEGVFDSSWEFHGIGSLGTKKDLLISAPNAEREYKLKLLPRVGFDQYKEMLSDFDIGISLMYSPHPSVPPLEMAKAGMVVVTTSFETRTSDVMNRISENLIASDVDLNSLVSSLKLATQRVEDCQVRVDRSVFDWPTRWEDVFNPEFICKFLKENHFER